MGQAKCRGTFEERKRLAIIRNKEEEEKCEEVKISQHGLSKSNRLALIMALGMSANKNF